jgi:putative transcriptional regulator
VNRISQPLLAVLHSLLPALCSRLSLFALLLAAPPVVIAAESAANGIFLVAAHALQDPNFNQAVVLVTQPEGGGPFGVIINKPLNYRLSELLADYEVFRASKDVVYFGGPVSRDALVFLVRSGQAPPSAIAVLGGVFFTGDVTWVDRVLARADAGRGLRVYSGYSGWAPEQLQNEIARGDWFVMPADGAMIFEKDPAAIWPELIERAALRRTRAAETDSQR